MWRRFYSVPATRFHPTVYAMSTPSNQRSAIGIVRISGSHSKHILELLTPKKSIVPRRPMVRSLYDPSSGVMLDEAIAIYFPQPKTYTGEDIVELHLHGGKAIVRAALKTIQSLNGPDREIRMAMPGEFSRRAFQNGKMDLLKLENINSMIHADTEVQRLSSLHSNRNRELFTSWRQKIIDETAKLTAIIDFGEDIEPEDVDEIIQKASDEICQLKDEINRFMFKIERMGVLNDGIKLTLVGEPNSGKSSLLNEISKDDISIVSNIPGTTRDSIDVIMDINGFKCILTDTAGIRHGTSDAIEIKGIDRSKRKSLESDLVMLVIDSSNHKIDKEFRRFVIDNLSNKPLIIVLNKLDLVDKKTLMGIKENVQSQFENASIHSISCLTKDGIETLVESLTKTFKQISYTEDEDPITLSSRVNEILQSDLLYGIEQFFHFKHEGDILMACESLRIASDGIGKITGENVDIEEVLDVVFSKFCIGK